MLIENRRYAVAQLSLHHLIFSGALVVSCSSKTTDPNEINTPSGSDSGGAIGTDASNAAVDSSSGTDDSSSAADDSSTAANDSAPPDGGGDAGNVPPVYAISTHFSTGMDTSSSILFTMPSLDEGTAPDYSQAIELPETAFLFGIPGNGKVYSLLSKTPTATRYDVDGAGKITKAQDLSFQQFGVGAANSNRSAVFVSDTKAYLLDDTTLHAIIWNPETMTASTAIDLTAMNRTGWVAYFGYGAKLRGTQIVVPAFYYDDMFSKTLTESTVALIDTTTDTATVISDTRCGGFTTSVAAPDGTIYFASDPYWGALNRVGGDAVSATGCMLRIKKGENAFDPGFFQTVKTITGGSHGGGIVPGVGATAYVRALDESLFPVQPTTTSFDVFAAAAWVWWQIDLNNPTAAASKATLPPAAGDLSWFDVTGRAILDAADADYTKTTLYYMNAPAGPTKGTTIKGYVSGIVKAR